VIRKRIRRSGEGFDVAADVNAVIAANVSERSTQKRASSRQNGVEESKSSTDKKEA